jgi:mannose-6-phosphate isomerase-like protein (cupin superfamily)
MRDGELAPEVMERTQIARLKNLRPTKYDFAQANVDVPVEAYEMVASKNIYLLLAPKERTRSFSPPAVLGAPGLEISIVDCPPGNGPPLHVHERTRETFMPLDGRYEVTWGANGEHSTVLDAFDMFAVPPGVYRSFRNVSPKDAKMLVVVQGEAGEVMNDICYQASLAKQVSARFGQAIWDRMSKIGLRVGAGD